jgi:hypothetical protein
MNEYYNIVVVVKVATAVRGGLAIREQRSRARSRRGGVSENQIAGAAAAAARLFFLTAVAIAIATRPFKYHETRSRTRRVLLSPRFTALVRSELKTNVTSKKKPWRRHM